MVSMKVPLRVDGRIVLCFGADGNRKQACVPSPQMSAAILRGPNPQESLRSSWGLGVNKSGDTRMSPPTPPTRRDALAAAGGLAVAGTAQAIGETAPGVVGGIATANPLSNRVYRIGVI